MSQGEPDRAEHLRDAGETIQELRAERHRQLSKGERIAEALMSRAGRPGFVLAVIAFIVLWVVLNIVLRPHHVAFDDESFPILNTISQLVSLVVVLTILSAQNSQRTLEEERNRLTLQMSLIIDKKVTEALRQISAGGKPELREPTDLHQAAEVLRKAEDQTGKDEEERAAGAEL